MFLRKTGTGVSFSAFFFPKIEKKNEETPSFDRLCSFFFFRFEFSFLSTPIDSP